MDFSWTEAQDEVYKRILSLVQNKLHVGDRHPSQSWTRAQWLLCGDLQLLGLSVPNLRGCEKLCQ